VGGPSGWSVRERRIDNVRSNRSWYYRGGMPLGAVWVEQGDKFVIPLADGNVLVFANRRLAATLSGHTDWVYAAAVSPDGKKVASGSADGTVKLWNLDDGKLLATLVQLTPRTDDWLAMTPQGYLATSSADALNWEAANVKTPPEQLPAVFTKPESVAQVLAGEEVAPPEVE
jgi:WD40 repeat protein